MRPPSISVVVPALNEERNLGAQLAALAAQPDLAEVIVVDGGSRDRTVAIAAEAGSARLVHAPPGRARQLNAGARAARGDVLLFLHADVRLPPDAAATVATTLSRPGTVAGAFRTWTVADAARPWWSPLLHLADVRSRYSALPYGDQALFVRAGDFWRAGGYPELALMEDLELSRRLTRLGRIRTCRQCVRVSGRRFIARPVHATLMVNLLPALYRLGVPPAVLAALYEHTR